MTVRVVGRGLTHPGHLHHPVPAAMACAVRPAMLGSTGSGHGCLGHRGAAHGHPSPHPHLTGRPRRRNWRLADCQTLGTRSWGCRVGHPTRTVHKLAARLGTWHRAKIHRRDRRPHCCRISARILRRWWTCRHRLRQPVGMSAQSQAAVRAGAERVGVVEVSHAHGCGQGCLVGRAWRPPVVEAQRLGPA